MKKLKKLFLFSLTFAFLLTLSLLLNYAKVNASNDFKNGIPSELQKTEWVSENLTSKNNKFNSDYNRFLIIIEFNKNKLMITKGIRIKKNGKISKGVFGSTYGTKVKYKENKLNSYYFIFDYFDNGIRGKSKLVFTIKDNKIIIKLNPRKNFSDLSNKYGLGLKNKEYISFTKTNENVDS